MTFFAGYPSLTLDLETYSRSIMLLDPISGTIIGWITILKRNRAGEVPILEIEVGNRVAGGFWRNFHKYGERLSNNAEDQPGFLREYVNVLVIL